MNTEKDLYGKALLDYQTNGFTEDIITYSTIAGKDIYPLPYLFRDYNEMPKIEQKALQLTKGKTLDIGCGAGSHSLHLQNKGIDIIAIDISEGAIETCKQRGIDKAEVRDIWEVKNKKLDTILLLMNGAGMCGKLYRLSGFLAHLKTLLNDNGQILLDSTDTIYMYENEDGEYEIDTDADYYGETEFVMEYQSKKSQSFNWLYIDFNTLQKTAALCGLQCELILKGDYFDYLARITLEK